MIYFATSNPGKFSEAQSILPELKQVSLNLPEIQEIDPKIIIKHKLQTAKKQLRAQTKTGGLVVGDTSLNLDCLDGLPGPLIKWFLKTVGDDGLAELAQLKQNSQATAQVILGYAELESESKQVKFFSGRIRGQIVHPKGENGFGWDKIFQPEGCSQTFAQMSLEQKNQISMRKQAFVKLKQYLDEQG